MLCLSMILQMQLKIITATGKVIRIEIHTFLISRLMSRVIPIIAAKKNSVMRQAIVMMMCSCFICV